MEAQFRMIDENIILNTHIRLCFTIFALSKASESKRSSGVVVRSFLVGSNGESKEGVMVTVNQVLLHLVL